MDETEMTAAAQATGNGKIAKKKNKKKKAAKAKSRAPKKEPPKELVIPLAAPGFTPILRAGVGGLAASLYAMAKEDPSSNWPSHIVVGKGSATVEKTRIVLRFGDCKPAETLEPLFKASFRLTPQGLIDLPGAYSRNVAANPMVMAALQLGLRRTFLQHGPTSLSGRNELTVNFEVDGQMIPMQTTSCTGYTHRDKASSKVLKAIEKGPQRLAGWAHPGGAVRHAQYKKTEAEYDAAAAVAACFAMVGCVCLTGPGSSGLLIILDVLDLLAFGKRRHRFTPTKREQITLSGPSDAALVVELAVAAAPWDGKRGVGRSSAVLLTPMAWDKKQKYRARTVSLAKLDPGTLALFDLVTKRLPSIVRPIKKVRKGSEKAVDSFVAPSALRAFVADNLAQGQPWYQGFATAKSVDGRIMHRFRTRDDNLGALFKVEKEALMELTKEIKDAEGVLVESVHVALRQRFGAISGDKLGNKPKRMSRETERWRLAFSGAKTHAQVRAALADLWSRAGPNKVLRENWQVVLPLLREEHWLAARDLALLALASYAGKDKNENKLLDDANNAGSDENQTQGEQS